MTTVGRAIPKSWESKANAITENEVERKKAKEERSFTLKDLVSDLSEEYNYIILLAITIVRAMKKNS